MHFKEKVASRKFLLMLMILLFTTSILTIPVLGQLFFDISFGVILTGGEYVSLIIGAFAIYSGANIAQKKVFEDQKEEDLDA